MPDAAPVAMAMLLSGCCCHHAWMMSGSVVASLRPLAVAGRLSRGRHGKMWNPRRRESQGCADHGSALLLERDVVVHVSSRPAPAAAFGFGSFCLGGRMRMQSTVLPRSVVVVG